MKQNGNDCCGMHECREHSNRGEKMEHESNASTENGLKASQWVLIGLGILFALSALQTFQLSNTLNSLTSQGPSATLTGAVTAASANAPIDMTGWTANEKMNYEMHGIIPARVQGAATNQPAAGSDITQGLPTQIGGC